MTTAVKTPMSQRINMRMIVFLGLVAMIVGWIVWKFVEVKLTGGIIDRGSYTEVDLFTISNFEMDQFNSTDEKLPKEFRDLDGKRVQLVGEMYQPFSVGGSVGEFDLVYSISKCCVTSSPKIQHFIKCKVIQGKKIQYHPGHVKVIGTLYVGIEKGPQRIASVYRMDVESVEPR